MKVSLAEEPLVPSLALKGGGLEKEQSGASLRKDVKGMLYEIRGVSVRRIGEDAHISLIEIRHASLPKEV